MGGGALNQRDIHSRKSVSDEKTHRTRCMAEGHRRGAGSEHVRGGCSDPSASGDSGRRNRLHK